MARPPHGTFCWNELATRGAGTARLFFTELLGWKAETIDVKGMTYTMFSAGDRQAGGLFEMDDEWEGIAPHWMPYIAVDDVVAAKARTEALGGTVHFGPHEAPGVGRFILIEDPTGAKVSLIEMDG